MYRKEALEQHFQPIWNNKILLLSRIPAWIYLSISVLLIILFITYLIFGSFTRRIDVNGEIVLLPHPVILTSDKSGYISEVFVAVGDEVKKNSPLFKIKLERVIESGDVGINSKLNLLSQISYTDKIISNLSENKKIALDNLESQIKNNQKIASDLEVRLQEIKQNIDDVSQLVDIYKKFQKEKIATKGTVIEQQLIYFQQNSLYQSFYSKLIQQQIQIATLKSELQTQENQFNSDILRYEIQKNDLNIKLMDIESISEFIVNSPIDGKIEATNVTLGQTVSLNSALTQINPSLQRTYKLVFWVPNNSIAYLKTNQAIKVRYDAFPYEKFGQFDANIETISTIPASAQELSFYKNSQINPDPNNPLYKITANVDREYVIYDDKQLAITNGMRAQVTVFLEKRPLYQWILLPLYSVQKNVTSE